MCIRDSNNSGVVEPDNGTIAWTVCAMTVGRCSVGINVGRVEVGDILVQLPTKNSTRVPIIVKVMGLYFTIPTR